MTSPISPYITVGPLTWFHPGDALSHTLDDTAALMAKDRRKHALRVIAL